MAQLNDFERRVFEHYVARNAVITDPAKNNGVIMTLVIDNKAARILKLVHEDPRALYG